MGLFTNPAVLTDGTDTRTFGYRQQLPSSKPGVSGSDYLEVGADPLAKSKLVNKHDLSKPVLRNLLQHSIHKVPAANADGTLKLITVNITVAADEEFTVAELQPEVNVAIDAAEETDWLLNARQGLL